MTETIGEYLRKNREHLGYRLEDVATAVNIRTGQLRAIEIGEIDKLPGMIYAVGFVKTYAKFLGLDPAAVGARFKQEHSGQPAPETGKKTKKLINDDPYADNRVPPGGALLAAFFLFCVCLGLWWVFKPDIEHKRALLTEIPKAPVIESTVKELQIPRIIVPDGQLIGPVQEQGQEIKPVVQSAEAPLEKPAYEPLPLKEKEKLRDRITASRIMIVAKESTWLEITDPSRRVLFKQLLHKGKSYRVPDLSEVILSTGNAGGLEFYVDGKKVLPIGRAGDILRGVALSPEFLLDRTR